MEQQKMERGLKPRHVEMIALGGTIGVGLFMGSANTIQMAGPSVLLCYAVTGVVMFFIMRIMGEMLYQEPVTGSFATYGHKYISPFVGYLTACSYWFLWVVVGLSEITAVGIYVHYWFPLLPQWISALAGMAIVAAANMAAVKYYGEFEFWFALIKVVTIIVMLIVGAAVILFGFGNGGVPVGISNLWVMLEVLQHPVALFKKPGISESDGIQLFGREVLVTQHLLEIGHIDFRHVTDHQDDLTDLTGILHQIVYGLEGIIIPLVLLVDFHGLSKILGGTCCGG